MRRIRRPSGFGLVAFVSILSGVGTCLAGAVEDKALEAYRTSPDISAELERQRLMGYVLGSAQAIRTGGGCGELNCLYDFLVLQPVFSKLNTSEPDSTITARVFWIEPGAAPSVVRVELRPLDALKTKPSSDSGGQQGADQRVNAALGRNLDLEALKQPDLQGDLRRCIAQAQSMYLTLIPRHPNRPRPSNLVVVRRLPGKNPAESIAVYLEDGYGDTSFTGEIWVGSASESRAGEKAIFEVGEIVDYLLVSPDRVLEGGWTKACVPNDWRKLKEKP